MNRDFHELPLKDQIYVTHHILKEHFDRIVNDNDMPVAEVMDVDTVALYRSACQRRLLCFLESCRQVEKQQQIEVVLTIERRWSSCDDREHVCVRVHPRECVEFARFLTTSVKGPKRNQKRRRETWLELMTSMDNWDVHHVGGYVVRAWNWRDEGIREAFVTQCIVQSLECLKAFNLPSDVAVHILSLALV